MRKVVSQSKWPVPDERLQTAAAYVLISTGWLSMWALGPRSFLFTCGSRKLIAGAIRGMWTLWDRVNQREDRRPVAPGGCERLRLKAKPAVGR